MDKKRRRRFLLAAALLAAAPRRVLAQSGTRRIGYLGTVPAAAYASRLEALRAGLHELGYVEGSKLEFTFRWADQPAQLPELAADLVRTNVELLCTNSAAAVEAARQATRTLPIVFTEHPDPVGLGHAASLRQPGGNATGLSLALTDTLARKLEMLKIALPQATRFAIVWNPATPMHAGAVQAMKGTAEWLGITLLSVALRRRDDFEKAFVAMAREGVLGAVVLAAPLFQSYRDRLAELALGHRLPVIYDSKDYVTAGGLMSHGADLADLHRRAAGYIDMIFKGANPADLPILPPAKYHMVVSLRAAQAMGLALSQSFLVRANERLE